MKTKEKPMRYNAFKALSCRRLDSSYSFLFGSNRCTQWIMDGCGDHSLLWEVRILTWTSGYLLILSVKGAGY